MWWVPSLVVRPSAALSFYVPLSKLTQRHASAPADLSGSDRQAGFPHHEQAAAYGTSLPGIRCERETPDHGGTVGGEIPDGDRPVRPHPHDGDLVRRIAK